MSEKKREDYIGSLREGHIVAYKNDRGMYTGKVIKVNDSSVEIQTINGSIYEVKKKNIAWVKTGSSWPTGIKNAIDLAKRKQV